MPPAVRSTARGVAPRGTGFERYGSGAYLRLTGFQAMRASLEQYREAARAVSGMRIVAGAEAFYAPFVNWGTRSMQGRHFLEAGMEAGLATLRTGIGPALARGPGGVRALFRQAALSALSAMQTNTPVRTGQLIRSERVRMYGVRG